MKETSRNSTRGAAGAHRQAPGAGDDGRLEVQEGEQVVHLEVGLVDGGDAAQERLQGALGLGDGPGVEGQVAEADVAGLEDGVEVGAGADGGGEQAEQGLAAPARLRKSQSWRITSCAVST